jgi:hypothetical protein
VKPTINWLPVSSTGRLISAGYCAISCQRLGFVDIGTLGLAQLLPHQAARIEQLFPAGAGIPVRQMALGNAGFLVIDEFVGDTVSESQAWLSSWCRSS